LLLAVAVAVPTKVAVAVPEDSKKRLLNQYLESSLFRLDKVALVERL
jgi:hypothetical protein